MPEGEILVHRYVQEIGEVGDGDGAVGPGARAVDFVVGLACKGDVVGDAAVAVVGKIVAEGDEGGEWVSVG